MIDIWLIDWWTGLLLGWFTIDELIDRRIDWSVEAKTSDTICWHSAFIPLVHVFLFTFRWIVYECHVFLMYALIKRTSGMHCPIATMFSNQIKFIAIWKWPWVPWLFWNTCQNIIVVIDRVHLFSCICQIPYLSLCMNMNRNKDGFVRKIHLGVEFLVWSVIEFFKEIICKGLNRTVSNA